MLGDLRPAGRLARGNDGIFVGESLQPETRDNAGKLHLKNLGNQKRARIAAQDLSLSCCKRSYTKMPSFRRVAPRSLRKGP